MDNTFFSIPENKMTEVAERIVISREDEGDEVNKIRPLKGGEDSALGGYTVPCGGIYSTPRDMAKFIIALMGKDIA